MKFINWQITDNDFLITLEDDRMLSVPRNPAGGFKDFDRIIAERCQLNG